MTQPTDSLTNNGLELTVAALAGIMTMAQQTLGDLRAMGFGDLVDRSIAEFADPERDAVFTAALEAAVVLNRLGGNGR